MIYFQTDGKTFIKLYKNLKCNMTVGGLDIVVSLQSLEVDILCRKEGTLVSYVVHTKINSKSMLSPKCN